MKTSVFPKFHNLSVEERLQLVQGFSGIDDKEVEILRKPSSIDYTSKNENVIGVYDKLLKIAPNFLINGRDYIVPMVTEEPSVVAAASNGAKLARYGNGFVSYIVYEGFPRMTSQVQITNVKDTRKALRNLRENKDYLLDSINKEYMRKHAHGKVDGIRSSVVKTRRGKMISAQLFVDVEDSMGANKANEIAEIAAPYIEKLTQGKSCLRVVSNLPDKRLFGALVKIPNEKLAKKGWTGEEVSQRIEDASAFAEANSYRAITNNKGILNGMCAVAEATGNDYRALEAGAHGYASLGGKYKPLSTWCCYKGELIGQLTVPMAIGIRGGATEYPKSKLSIKMLGVKSSNELGEIMASVGLANNLAALRELVTDGIQKGHMKIHKETFSG